MGFTMQITSNEIIGQRDFKNVAGDVFQDAVTGDLCILEPGTDQVLLVQRSNIDINIFK